MSKLISYNNIFVEFDAKCCLVRDKMAVKEILKRKLKELYQLSRGHYGENKDPCIYMSIK